MSPLPGFWSDQEGQITRFVECLQCACRYSYAFRVFVAEKQTLFGNADAIAGRTVQEKLRTGHYLAACPACGYMSRRMLFKGRLGYAVVTAILAVVPLFLMLIVLMLRDQFKVLPVGAGDVLMVLLQVLVALLLIAAPVVGWFYHPRRFPYSRWEQETRIVRHGRPLEQWNQVREGLLSRTDVILPAGSSPASLMPVAPLTKE